MQNHPKKFFIFGIIALLALAGCAAEKPQETATAVKPAVEQAENVLKGKIAGKSNKAKSISIVVGKGDKAKTVMLKFDDNTKGIEFAKKGSAAIIKYEMKDGEKFATIIKPKLAKLPAGVTEIKTAELRGLYENHADMTVIDARPASRYAQARLPGAISIPVPEMKMGKETVLPANKDQLLVFYCGGPT